MPAEATPAAEAPPRRRLTPDQVHELTRWNTPSVYNGWEQITAADGALDGVNVEPTADLMPDLHPMAGFAVTCVISSRDPAPRKANPHAVMQYLRYVAAQPGPCIAVVQDLDAPRAAGSFWGEVNASIHRALGCVGTITDGSVRDVVEMAGLGFKTLARGLCVGHAHAYPIRWGCDVTVFGRVVRPGQLLHADRHGFLAVPEEDEPGLLDATRFMDAMECRHLIPRLRHAIGQDRGQTLAALEEGLRGFAGDLRAKFGRRGEF